LNNIMNKDKGTVIWKSSSSDHALTRTRCSYWAPATKSW
jgi:hypothetical protein